MHTHTHTHTHISNLQSAKKWVMQMMQMMQ